MTPRPDRRWPFTFVEDLDAPTLAPADRHHLERVLRLRPGDRLTVGDGAGRFRPAIFGEPLAVAGDVLVAPVPAPPITVAFALTKAGKPELVVQKLAEIGADRLLPFVASRSVVRWEPEKAIRQVERWRAIAREAAAQAHRPHLPEVAAIGSFEAAAGLPGAVLAHPDGTPLEPGDTTILIGPEGGWTPEEEAAVVRWRVLGPHILRAETAALVAAALAVAAHRR